MPTKTKYYPATRLQTSRGRAQSTTHWFSSGNQWIWNYDLLSYAEFQNLVTVVTRPPKR